MDSFLASFKGFFYMEEDGEADDAPPQESEEANEEVKSPQSTDEEEQPPSTNEDESGTMHSITDFHEKINNAYNYQRRVGRSFLADIFWSKTDDSKSVKATFLASSSSESSPPHRFDPRDSTATTSQSYVSDTSSTQSSSGDDNSNNNQQRRRGRAERRDINHMADTQQPHLQLFSHGKFWTLTGILATWIGFALAYQAFVSTQFVTLQEPMYVDPVWQEVTQVGMINLKLCYNETRLEEIGDTSTAVGAQTECTIHPLSTDEIDDTMFQTARSMAFLAVSLGGFVSVMMTTSFIWHSINLRPIGLGYMLAYFLQSFTFLFFDADLCTDHKCRLAQGSRLSAVASLCWIVACIAAARMDSHKFQKSLEWVQASRGRSRSRSASPQKRPGSPMKKKTLQRRTTDGTAPLSDDSFSDGVSPREDMEMTIETSWRRAGHTSNNRSRDGSGRSNSARSDGRRFASNGCEIIQGIQDLEAAQAWAAKSPKAVTPKKSTSPRKPSRSKRPNLTIDVDEANASRHSSQMSSTAYSSHMGSTAYSIGSPIQPSTRQHRFGIRPMPSPSKRLDHTGDIQRAESPIKRRTSVVGSPTSLSTADDIISTPSSESSGTAKRNAILRELDELDTLVQRATSSARSARRNHPDSVETDGLGASPASDAGVLLVRHEQEKRHSSHRGQSARPHSTTASGYSRHSGSKNSSRPVSASTSGRHSTHTTTEEHRARRSVVFDFLVEDESDDDIDLKERRSRRSSRAQR